MDTTRLSLQRLAEKVLAGHGLPLPLLLEVLVPVRRLRDLARELGLSPVGFRAEKAPARLLASMLAELRDPGQLDAVLQALLAGVRGAPEPDAPAATATPIPTPDAAPEAPVLRLKDEELDRVRGELERARQGAARALERESELRQALERSDGETRRLRTEIERRRQPAAQEPSLRAEADRELIRRVHELEQEVEARAAADEALRRQLASDRSRIRELEDEVAELAALVPRGRKRKQAPAPPPERRFLLPWFLPSFYRSLDGKERKSVERALQAILLFCTEGHAYPGLEVKQLGGHETWSLRASLGLRVYFRHRDDGDIEIIELADREEQHTTLRRLKER